MALHRNELDSRASGFKHAASMDRDSREQAGSASDGPYGRPSAVPWLEARGSRERAGAEIDACRPSSSSKMSACAMRSEEHTSELPSLLRNSYAGFCLKKKIYKVLNTKRGQTCTQLKHKP